MTDNTVLLAIRLRQLGDVLATLGTLREIKNARPQIRLAFMVDRHYHALLCDVEYIDLLLPEPPRFGSLPGAIQYYRFVDRLRRLNIDCVLDFHSNARSALLSYLSGAPKRIGFDVRARKLLYTEVEPRAVFGNNGAKIPRTSHESAMALAGRCIPLDGPGSVAHTIRVSPEASRAGLAAMATCGIRESVIGERRAVGLNPGNPYPAKEWREENFVELARELVGEGKSVVVIWGPGERERADRIVNAAGTGVSLAPGLSLNSMPGFLKHLGALVTIDSGLKHLAVAIGVPTVTLFGPTDPGEWHMGGESDRYLFAGLSCSPCRLLECPFGGPCMSNLRPAHVLRELSVIEGGIGVS